MAMDFPSSPAVGDSYTKYGVTYLYTGQGWTSSWATRFDSTRRIKAQSAPLQFPECGSIWFDTATNQLKEYSCTTSSWQVKETVIYGSPVYVVTNNFDAINEGQTLIFYIRTVNVADGTIVNWSIDGIDSSDITAGSLNGTSMITSGVAQVSITLSSDVLSEGDETVTFSLIGLGVTAIAQIIDTSITPVTPTYSITSSAISVNEGETVDMIINTTNVADGTIVYWTVAGSIGAQDFFDITSGSTTITGGTSTVTLTVLEDVITEGSESFQMDLHTDSASGPIVTQSQVITINDTSVPVPAYWVTHPTAVTEGTPFTVTVTTSNVPDGTVLYWTIAGTVSPADFSDSSLGGSFTITNNSGSFIRSLVADTTTEGSEQFTISIRTGSTTGPVVVTGSTSTASDTSITPPVGYAADEFVFTVYMDSNGFPGQWQDPTSYLYNIIPADSNPAVIYWGDGTSTSVTSARNFPNHTYAEYDRDYIVRIKNAKYVHLATWWKDIIQFSNIPLVSMDGMFSEYPASTTLPAQFTCGTSLPDTSQCISWLRTFQYNEAFNIQPMNIIDTANFVVNAPGGNFWMMFGGQPAGQSLPNISGWDMSNAARTHYMFYNCKATIPNLSNWNMGKVYQMDHMFYNSSMTHNLSSWCVGLIPWEPYDFGTGAPAFAKPLWGTCSSGQTVPIAGYKIELSTDYPNEGDTVTVSIRGINTTNGTTVYWQVYPVDNTADGGNIYTTADDLNSPLTGSFTVSNSPVFGTGNTSIIGSFNVNTSSDGAFNNQNEKAFNVGISLSAPVGTAGATGTQWHEGLIYINDYY